MKHLLAVIASHLLAALAASAPDKFINIAYNQTVDTGPLNTSPGVHDFLSLLAGRDVVNGTTTLPAGASDGFDLVHQDWLWVSFAAFTAHLELQLDYQPGGGEFVGSTLELEGTFTGFGLAFIPVLEIRALVKADGPVKLTQGIDVSLQSEATLLVPLGPDDSHVAPLVHGFDGASVTLGPFQSPTAGLAASVSLALRLGLNVTRTPSSAAGAHLVAQPVIVSVDVPSVELIATPETRVDATCVNGSSSGPIYEQLTRVETTLTFPFVTEGETIPAPANTSKALVQPVQCFAFDAASGKYVAPTEAGKVVSAQPAHPTAAAAGAPRVSVVVAALAVALPWVFAA